MNVRSGLGFRAWMLGGAATILVGPPAALLAQSADSAAPRNVLGAAVQRELEQASAHRKPVHPLATHNAAAPAPPSVPTIQQVSAEGPSATDAQKSEVQRQLELLYARDGRPMPPMTPGSLPQNSATRQMMQPASQPAQPAGSPMPTVSASRDDGNTVTDFFKRLIPGGRDESPVVQPARPIAPPAMSQSQSLSQPGLLPQNIQPTALAPTGRTPAPVIAPAGPAVALPAQPAPVPATDFPDPFPEGSEAVADQGMNPLTVLTLDDVAPPPAVQAPVELAPLPAVPEQPLAQTPTIPEPAADPQPSSPFTDKTLEPVGRVRLHVTGEDDHTEKFEQIAARGELPGLKGFCPVTLRDDRSLSDARDEFRSTYRGQTFRFASAEAKARFDANPEPYVPAAFGHDVVLLDSAQVVPGTLDHAVWYKGRLYLFSNAATMETFRAAPKYYAAAE